MLRSQIPRKEINRQSQNTMETLLSIVEAEQQQEMPHTQKEEVALPDCLAFCPAADAPLATALRKQLKGTLGPDTAQSVIAKLSYRTMRQSNKMVRLFCFEGNPVAHRI